MTLLNAWWDRGGRDRHAYIQCDRCLPPQLDRGSADSLLARGWGFERLEGDRHRCPWCRRRGLNRRPRRVWPPERSPGLPNLIVIGAAKCGTTSLHRYLDLHPEVHMSRPKEVNFFQDPACLEKLDVYATFFDAGAPVRGEASARYTYHPLLPGVPERIRAAVPEAKLIYLVRDPVERVFSGYVQTLAQRPSYPSLEQALLDIDNQFNVHVAAGRYATQLERYRLLFPADQLLVIDQVDLLDRRRETLRRVFHFLAVDEDFTSPGFDDLANTRGGIRRLTGVYHTLAHNRVTVEMRRRLPPAVHRAASAPVRRLASRTIEPPAVEPELRRRLRDVLRPEVERLRALTGQEFASWQI